MNGIELIAEERERQISEGGWDTYHDDYHCQGELAVAAACYALPKEARSKLPLVVYWPWEMEWWKPSPDNRVKELTKAGALIAAEIDRLQRVKTL